MFNLSMSCDRAFQELQNESFSLSIDKVLVELWPASQNGHLNPTIVFDNLKTIIKRVLCLLL